MVRGLRNNFAATSRLDSPSAMKVATCFSCAVSVTLVEASRFLAVSDHAPAIRRGPAMLTQEDDVSLYVPGRGVLWLS